MSIDHHFGRSSLANMRHVDPRLILVAGDALRLSPLDISFTDGARELETQRMYVESGVSKTMDSKHLIQPSGYAEAMDLVPYLRGGPRWELGPCTRVAAAVWRASKRLQVDLKWGGVWDRRLHELDVEDLEREVRKYMERRQTRGLTAFIDAPHFELV